MKSDIFNNELSYIQNIDIKEFARYALNNLQDYFYEVPASSTGKYHPNYALGDGGLVRHTKAAVGFANHLLQLEQYQQLFNERQRDMIIVALLLHDGNKHGSNGSRYTVHEHPKLMADWIIQSELFEDMLSQEDRAYIANCVASHMGEWAINKRSKIELPKPQTESQKFVHMCDYLASRKNIEFVFSNEDNSQQEVSTVDNYRLTFGKHRGELLVDVAKNEKSYLEWLKGNLELREPLNLYIDQLI